MNWESELANPPPFDPKLGKNAPRHPRHVALSRAAGKWATCPMSEVNVRKRKWPWDGVPVDREIAQLGYTFFDHIEDGQWEKAKNVLAQIRSLTANP